MRRGLLVILLYVFCGLSMCATAQALASMTQVSTGSAIGSAGLHMSSSSTLHSYGGASSVSVGSLPSLVTPFKTTSSYPSVAVTSSFRTSPVKVQLASVNNGEANHSTIFRVKDEDEEDDEKQDANSIPVGTPWVLALFALCFVFIKRYNLYR